MPPRPALTPAARALLAEARRATLATVDPAGRPRPVPVCYAVAEAPAGVTIWTPIDAKPKVATEARALARVRDILERPVASLVADRWSEDWTALAWVRLIGEASLVEPADDPAGHAAAVALLRARYPQYLAHPLETAPIIRIAVTEWIAWEATPGDR